MCNIIFLREGGVMVSKPLPSLRWEEHAQAHEGTRWDAKNRLIL
jgi:hypothetical protein